MKSFVIVALLLVALYVFFVKKNASQPQPAPATASAQVASPAPSGSAGSAGSAGQDSNVLKRPIDRTREVLGTVRKNQESNQF
jgi:opacity protein-like surface antigen